MISLPSALMRQFEEHGPIDGSIVPANTPYVLGTDLNRSESRELPVCAPKDSTARYGSSAAMRDFDSAYDRFGSFASD